VVLGLPTPVAALAVRSEQIVTAMGENKSTFLSPPVALATVSGHIADLTAAEAAFKSRSGSKADRDAKKAIVVADCKQLHIYVQQLAAANPAQAATIAQQAAMSLRKPAAAHKSDLATAQSVTGSVAVAAKAVKGARSYEWSFSTDGGKTWSVAPPSTRANTTITGLVPGVLTQFRQRAVTKTGATEWSQPVAHMVS
jgi:hypothetical protein